MGFLLRTSRDTTHSEKTPCVLQSPTDKIGTTVIELLVVLPTPWDQIRAIGQDIDRRFSGSTTQTISGTGLTTVQIAPGLTDSQLEIVAKGSSRIEFVDVLFTERTISGLRDAGPQPEPPVSPDNITVTFTDEFAAGPQPEPPRVRVTGYGAEDQINVAGATLTNGTPLPTDFNLNVMDSEDKIELLVVYTGNLVSRVGFDIETGEMGAAPALGFFGDFSVENSVKVVRDVALDLGMFTPLPIIIRNIRQLEFNGSTDPEGLSVSTLADGGLQIDSVNLQDIGRDIYITADQYLTAIQSDGGGGLDRFDMQYDEPSFRPVTTNLAAIELLVVHPVPGSPGLISQTLTPTTGVIQANSFLVNHDAAPTNFVVDGSNVDVTVKSDAFSDTFTRDLSLNYRYLGSEGDVLIDAVTFKQSLELNVQQKAGVSNSTDVKIQNSTFEKQAVIKISGGENGESKVKVSKKSVAGSVQAIYGSKKTILDMQLENSDETPLDATIVNPDGITKLTKVGNVIVHVPDLIGTDIDPTEPFITFVVTNTNDTDVGSLRAAIETANAYSGKGRAVITFAIPETDPNSLDVDAILKFPKFCGRGVRVGEFA